ncbi:MAG: nadB [Gammaproteobacteria bacterium]|jgi:L-aspartate oxidase|nr:nadB [Gammaproteobacteria bacterium]
MIPQTISQRGKRENFDAIVIGSGIAGLCYILELAHLQPNARVALLCKSTLTQSNSYYAQGGIAAAHPPEDLIEQHIADTIAAGDYHGDAHAIELLLQQGPESIRYLMAQGVEFDHDASDKPILAQEGGHSARRVYHCGDHTGAAIIQALIKKLAQLKNVKVLENHIAINLIKQNEEVVGTYVLDEKSELIHTFFAKVIVLATGGAGRVYRYTSNPDTATGDGVAMAYRAGAAIRDMEFYQFHPTLLYHPTVNNFLISEALRGEGAYLRLADTGERFMQRYAPEAMELATRDVVARAIFSEIERSHFDYVHLDIRHIDKTLLKQRFPTIYKTLQGLGLDLSQDLIPVVPAAHYMCGGVIADVNGQTSLARLFAIGETAATGLHGANRLASNSLLEGVIMGRNAARISIDLLKNPLPPLEAISDWDSRSVVDLRRASQVHGHWRGLRGEMTSYAGIVRTEAGLKDQLKLIHTRKNMVEQYYWRHSITRDLIELRNIICVAELIVRAALARQESRGGHYREDYPLHLTK